LENKEITHIFFVDSDILFETPEDPNAANTDVT